MAAFTIVSHNVFWFQGAPFEPEQPGPPHAGIMEALARLYSALNANVYCLQEIQSDECFQAVAAQLGLRGHFCSGRRKPQYGGAMLWHQGKPVADSLDHNPAPHRMWQVAAVVAPQNTVLRIANLHLTSARFLTQAEAARERIEEIESLLDTQPNVDVIAGDFNEGPRQGVAERLEEAGFVDASIATGVSVDSTGIGKLRSDQIWVRDLWAGKIESFGYLGWNLLGTDLNGAKFLSDHLPLWITLDV